MSKLTEATARGSEPATPELDRIIDEVLRGERVVLFPPGSVPFIGANFAVLFGSAVLCISVLQLWFGDGIPERAIAQLTGAALATMLSVIPGALVALGFKNARRIMRSTAGMLLACALIAVGAALFGVGISMTAGIISAGLLGFAIFMIENLGYRTYALYQLRLRQRRAMRR